MPEHTIPEFTERRVGRFIGAIEGDECVAVISSRLPNTKEDDDYHAFLEQAKELLGQYGKAVSGHISRRGNRYFFIPQKQTKKARANKEFVEYRVSCIDFTDSHGGRDFA